MIFMKERKKEREIERERRKTEAAMMQGLRTQVLTSGNISLVDEGQNGPIPQFLEFLRKKHCFRNKWQSTTFSRTRVSETRVFH